MEDFDDEGYYDDNYFDEEALWEEMQRHKIPEIRRAPLGAVLENCAFNVFRNAILDTILFILVCSLLQRIIAKLPFLHCYVKYACSIGMGLFLCARMNDLHGLYCMLALTAVSFSSAYFIRQLKATHEALLMALSSVGFMLGCQIFYLEKEAFENYRGTMMMMVMKLISLPLHSEQFDFVAGVAYVLDCSSLVFGPWIPYENYVHMLNPDKERPFVKIREVLAIFRTLVLSISFLLLSTCFSHWIFPDEYVFYSKWIIAYRDAQAFRSSHYFSTLTSQLSLLIAGYSLVEPEFEVSDPWAMEFPRSLVAGVVKWNIPMHKWLKKYVFEACGDFLASWKLNRDLISFSQRFITFVIASLIHGINFQLSSILLSLGFYTYIEYSLRKWLAETLNACVRSWACKPGCSHSYTKYHPLTMLINAAFFLLAVFHLMYLGAPFDANPVQEIGYNMQHTLKVWGNLDWLSHKVAGVCLLFTLIVTDQLSIILVPSMLVGVTAFGYQLIQSYEGEM